MINKVFLWIFTMVLLSLAGCGAQEKADNIPEADLLVKHWGEMSERSQIEIVKTVLEENEMGYWLDREDNTITGKQKSMDSLFSKKKYQNLSLQTAILKYWSGEELIQQEKEVMVKWSLEGESDNWRVKEFTLQGGSNHFDAGGSLEMKHAEEYQSQYFSYDAHVVISNVDREIFGGSLIGGPDDTTNINKKHNLGIEGGSFIHENGFPVKPEDIDKIYMDVEWFDTEKSKKVKERISLYTRE
ncbi:hypothetical protein FZC79_15180 [Rossellomorea vietnamensis]|uniref:Lipoprotein n=1 Tax=Rossellomorea vietnamensis TaxID=218284 RepID=A0A5D4KBA4_9BACI|nr:hypothetical protein [Rossellomorea vietnamensis]TYR74159.1 hypothetical protein FZC79_15180 [Rossellomorea vietnamensis]